MQTIISDSNDRPNLYSEISFEKLKYFLYIKQENDI